MLIRPDGYLAWATRADDPPPLATWLGHPLSRARCPGDHQRDVRQPLISAADDIAAPPSGGHIAAQRACIALADAHRARRPWLKIRQLTDVSHCNLQHHFSRNQHRAFQTLLGPSPVAAAQSDQRSRASSNRPTKEPGERDGADTSGRAAPVPHPADHGTGHGGRRPRPGTGGHLGLGCPCRP